MDAQKGVATYLWFAASRLAGAVMFVRFKHLNNRNGLKMTMCPPLWTDVVDDTCQDCSKVISIICGGGDVHGCTPGSYCLSAFQLHCSEFS